MLLSRNIVRHTCGVGMKRSLTLQTIVGAAVTVE